MKGLRRRKFVSRAMTGLTTLSAVLVIGALLIIMGYIAITGARELSLGFLINTPKPVGEPGSGIANAIVGTFILIGVASLIGMPVGILAGIYLAEFGSNKFGTAVRFLIDTLTGVPSIVVGVVVWTVMVRPMGHFSALAGGVALAIIMMPIVARTTEEMVRLVPHSLREASLALGAPVWRMSLGVVLRTAAGGVATGVMLAIARIAGETAPLLFTALSYNYMSTDLSQPIASLTYQIYYYAGSPYDQWHSMAWAATLVLVGMILAINVTVRLLAGNRYQ
ncbi:MAG TPA: phosphate ABC transporter permease PstA [Blastocatellia bacterium]|jgi:phosphate transport system permease protein|nr:phosphate ABC transporter permease PstA [Blastocatellia bacterium]